MNYEPKLSWREKERYLFDGEVRVLPGAEHVGASEVLKMVDTIRGRAEAVIGLAKYQRYEHRLTGKSIYLVDHISLEQRERMRQEGYTAAEIAAENFVSVCDGMDFGADL